MNPNYIQYCNFYGNDPELQLEIDSKLYPGGCMTGYILWISDRVREYLEFSKISYDGFTRYLIEYVQRSVKK